MLRRFADARLRRDVDRLASRLADATQTVRRMDGLLRQKTVEARTNYDLAQRWKSTAQQARTDIRDRYEQIARLELQVARLEKQCNEQMHQLAAERARTQETQP